MSIPQGTLEVVVSDHRCLAPGIHQLELAPAAAGPLPPAPSGAHLDIVLPDSQVRQYSLLDDAATGRYRIGVLRERESRGGSAFLAERARPGTRLRVSPPHSHFRLDESARHSVLIAGGIGVTPLVAMARRLAGLPGAVEMHYLVRYREQAAFLDELRSVLPEGTLHLHVSSQAGRVDLGALMGQAHPDKRVYACGPNALLNAVEQIAQGWPPGALRLERFRNEKAWAPMAGNACRVELQRSGHHFTLQAGESLLEALEREGFSPPSLCQEGVCGTCAIPVIAGEIEHRDALQSADEKATNDIIYACVSRPTGSTLVLDL
ncbi:Ferredoxin-NADP reductase [Modicisalibacter muralis]|uniref:Ferredoxin-NADP reductase n=1 Tax=Modicisalibacter muralis TaxID=119000 RepID=A0A1G9PMK1_9GAMM|nr:PDR/VanB family oxidoreductase [Halomonas muralis]SDL99929.1 Ferredoxin-NADP reductase [Halomonas muralis]